MIFKTFQTNRALLIHKTLQLSPHSKKLIIVIVNKQEKNNSISKMFKRYKFKKLMIQNLNNVIINNKIKKKWSKTQK